MIDLPRNYAKTPQGERGVVRLVVFFLALGFCSGAWAGGKVGYGSATTVISPSFQENVFIGFELGFEKKLGAKRAREILVTKHVNDKSLRAAITASQGLVDAGAVFLVGFPVSHDALLVGDYAQKNGILALFGAAAHSDLAKKGPGVLSTGSSMEHLLEQLEAFLRRTFAGKRGLAVVNPYAVFSSNQVQILKDRMAANPELKIEIRNVSDALVLAPNDLADLKAGKYDYLYLTLYPDDQVALLDQLTSAGVDKPMVTWGGPDPDILRRYITKLKSTYYIGSPWMPDRQLTAPLDKLMQARYQRPSNSEVVIGYNLGLVAGEIVSRVKGELTRESALKALDENRCFAGISTKPLCFPKTGGHASLTVEFEAFVPGAKR